MAESCFPLEITSNELRELCENMAKSLEAKGERHASNYVRFFASHLAVPEGQKIRVSEHEDHAFLQALATQDYDYFTA